MPTRKVTSSFDNVIEDNSRVLNVYAIRYASMKGWITDRDRAFYQDISRKRKLTDRQSTRRHKINDRLTERFKLDAGE